MTTENRVYLGDIGTVITLDCESDISAATVRKILVRKPDGSEIEWTASQVGTSLIYTIALGDLDQSGEWSMQAYVETPAGKWRGETYRITVNKKHE